MLFLSDLRGELLMVEWLQLIPNTNLYKTYGILIFSNVSPSKRITYFRNPHRESVFQIIKFMFNSIENLWSCFSYLTFANYLSSISSWLASLLESMSSKWASIAVRWEEEVSFSGSCSLERSVELEPIISNILAKASKGFPWELPSFPLALSGFNLAVWV